MKLIRGRCPYCNKVVACRTPRGGDGSIEVPVFHRYGKKNRKPCDGWAMRLIVKSYVGEGVK